MTDANAAFLRMTGYTHDELLTLDWKVLTPPEWMPATERAAADPQHVRPLSEIAPLLVRLASGERVPSDA